jgi:hypothetical protein
MNDYTGAVDLILTAEECRVIVQVLRALHALGDVSARRTLADVVTTARILADMVATARALADVVATAIDDAAYHAEGVTP